MAIVTSYTDGEIKKYMEKIIGKTATDLGISAALGFFDEASNEILYTLGLSDFSSITTSSAAKKVRTIAKVEAWRTVMYNTVPEASHSAAAPGTGQVNRADIHRHAKYMFELAKTEMTDNYPDLIPQEDRNVSKISVRYSGDVYANS